MALRDRSRTERLTPIQLLHTAWPIAMVSVFLAAASGSPADAHGRLPAPTIRAHSFSLRNFNGSDVLTVHADPSPADEIADQILAVWTDMAQSDNADRDTILDSNDDDNQSSDDSDDSDS